jgi:hypothetical protein
VDLRSGFKGLTERPPELTKEPFLTVLLTFEHVIVPAEPSPSPYPFHP